MNNYEKNMHELEEMAAEWKCSLYEAATELVTIFYDAAGIEAERLSEMLAPLTEQEMIKACMTCYV